MNQQSMQFPAIPEDAGITTIEVVTPEVAAELLRRNVHNRRLREDWVRELARRITEGRWSVTHQGIAIAKDGTVIDGQHRLSAVVLSAKPILIRVTRGLSREAQWDIDKGLIRKIGDEININEQRAGVVDAKRGKDKQAIASVLADNIAGLYASTLSDALKAMEPFKEGIDFVLSCGFRKHLAVAPVRAAVAIAFKTDPPKVSEFYTSFLSGANLPDGAPALALRNIALAGQRMARSCWSLKRKLFLCTCRSIEAHINGEPLKLVRPSVASFELFIGLSGLKSSIRETGEAT